MASRQEDGTRVEERRFEAIVVGAGFAGLYMLHRLRGLGLTAHGLEAGSDVGGTWYWNRYPGARCDIESLAYSYSFSRELETDWEWSERYATQPEILRYLQHVADRFELRRDITFGTRVAAATYDDDARCWTIETDRGDRLSARFCIMATGSLSAARIPPYEGLSDFEGETYHTGFWPHEPVDFRGKRVAVIGTGSSGVQAIPLIAEDARHLTVFQRTPNFSVPAVNRKNDPEFLRNFKADYPERRRRLLNYELLGAGDLDMTPELRKPPAQSVLAVSEEERICVFERRWHHGGGQILSAFPDIMSSLPANEAAAEFIRSKIREIVQDPVTAEMLMPTGYPVGTKRICVDTGFYATFNRSNVSLVDVRKTPIEKITAKGIRTTDAEHPLDAIVFATGYDAMTGPMLNIDIKGLGGLSLRAKWSAGPRTYLGLGVAGFPNMFIIAGPGSPSVLSIVVMSIEQHVDWIAGCLNFMRAGGFTRIEASIEAEDSWVEHVNAVASATLHRYAKSWYSGANIEGKPNVFMPYAGGIVTYRQICERIAARDYDGFALTPPGAAEPALRSFGKLWQGLEVKGVSGRKLAEAVS